MALAAAFVLQRAAATVHDALHVEEERVIQPLRRNVLNRNRSIKTMPGPSKKMHLNGFGDIDRAVRHDDRFGLKGFDAQLAGGQSRSGGENKNKNQRDCEKRADGNATRVRHSKYGSCLMPSAR